MTRVVLATDDAAVERRLLEALPDGPALCRRRGELRYLPAGKVLDELADEGADVLLLDLTGDADGGLALAEALDQERPGLTVLLLATLDARLWERALRAGVRDVIAPDATGDRLRDSVERALQATDRLRAELAGPPPDACRTGRVIAVLSPKGGAGKTTVATNLAIGLAAREGQRVAIADLDLQFGDVAGALQLTPEHSLADMPGSLDLTTLKIFLTPHPSGLFALCAPDDPAAAENLTSDHVAGLVQALAVEMSHVVLDTSAGIDEITLAAIEASTDLVLLGAMDVPSLRGLRKAVGALDRLGMTTQRRHLVLNRADSKVGLTVPDVEAALGMAVDVTIPSSRAVPLSVNTGSPVIEADTRTPVARAMSDLVARFVDTPSSGGGSWWKKAR